jgi:circadian clock protein KaiC
MKLRGRDFRAGHHDFNIRPGGLRVYPRLIAAEHHREFQAGLLLSGIAGIDALLGGGVDRGTSALLLGPPGSGKSSLAMQYVMTSVAGGDKAALFTFEETLRTLLTRAQGLGQNIGKQLETGGLILRQIDPAEFVPGEFAHLVRQAVEQEGVKVVVIDSLNGYLSSMPEGRFLMLHLHELLTYLAQQGVTTFLIAAQQGMVGTSMLTPVDASYLADTVIVLRFFEALGEVRQAISVLKRRGGLHERSIRDFALGTNGIQVGEPIRDFEGVLTGVPKYLGNRGP